MILQKGQLVYYNNVIIEVYLKKVHTTRFQHSSSIF
jgi:hypothetical protein